MEPIYQKHIKKQKGAHVGIKKTVLSLMLMSSLHTQSSAMQQTKPTKQPILHTMQQIQIPQGRILHHLTSDESASDADSESDEKNKRKNERKARNILREKQKAHIRALEKKTNEQEQMIKDQMSQINFMACMLLKLMGGNQLVEC